MCEWEHVYTSTSKPFLVLSCLHLGLQEFKLSLGFTLWEVVQVIILRCYFQHPFSWKIQYPEWVFIKILLALDTCGMVYARTQAHTRLYADSFLQPFHRMCLLCWYFKFEGGRGMPSSIINSLKATESASSYVPAKSHTVGMLLLKTLSGIYSTLSKQRKIFIWRIYFPIDCMNWWLLTTIRNYPVNYVEVRCN